MTMNKISKKQEERNMKSVLETIRMVKHGFIKIGDLEGKYVEQLLNYAEKCITAKINS